MSSTKIFKQRAKDNLLPSLSQNQREFELQRNTPPYQLAKYNCSHVVAECLKIACEKEPSFYPSAHFGEREELALQALIKRTIPTVLVGGGGYSKDSANNIIAAMPRCTNFG